MLQRPESGEYYDYVKEYIGIVPDGDLGSFLRKQIEAVEALLGGISEEQANGSYAPGKWTLKEIVSHMADGERVMSYRLLRAARGDTTSLPGFDQDLFVQGVSLEGVPLSVLIEDWKAVRAATFTLFAGITDEAWLRRGVVGGNDISARALAYVIAGHVQHHLNVIEGRYLA